MPNKNDQVVQKVSLRWQRGFIFLEVRSHLSVGFAASSPPGEPSPCLPFEGRWHGASRDGEVAAPHAPTIGTSRSPYRDGVGAAAGGGEVRPLKTLRIGGRGIMH